MLVPGTSSPRRPQHSACLLIPEVRGWMVEKKQEGFLGHGMQSLRAPGHQWEVLWWDQGWREGCSSQDTVVNPGIRFAWLLSSCVRAALILCLPPLQLTAPLGPGSSPPSLLSSDYTVHGFLAVCFFQAPGPSPHLFSTFSLLPAVWLSRYGKI